MIFLFCFVIQTQSLVQSLQEQLEEKKNKESSQELFHQQKTTELEQHMSAVTQELLTLQQEERKNMTLVASLTEEKDQLKVDFQENLDKVSVSDVTTWIHQLYLIGAVVQRRTTIVEI